MKLTANNFMQDRMNHNAYFSEHNEETLKKEVNKTKQNRVNERQPKSSIQRKKVQNFFQNKLYDLENQAHSAGGDSLKINRKNLKKTFVNF